MKKILILFIVSSLLLMYSINCNSSNSKTDIEDELKLNESLKEIKLLQLQLIKIIIEKPENKNTAEFNKLKNKYTSLCENISGGIVMTTMNGTILEANIYYQKMVGYNLKELRNLTYQQLTPKKWHEMEKNIVQKAMNEECVKFKKEYIRKNGTRIPISLTGWVLKDSSGKALGTGSLVIDFSKK